MRRPGALELRVVGRSRLLRSAGSRHAIADPVLVEDPGGLFRVVAELAAKPPDANAHGVRVVRGVHAPDPAQQGGVAQYPPASAESISRTLYSVAVRFTGRPPTVTRRSSYRMTSSPSRKGSGRARARNAARIRATSSVGENGLTM